MSDLAISDALSALPSDNPNVADRLQLFAQKQVQETQMATVAGLISSLSPQTMLEPGLGGYIDVRV